MADQDSRFVPIVTSQHENSAREISRQMTPGSCRYRTTILIKLAMQSGWKSFTFKGNSACKGYRNTVEALGCATVTVASCIELQA